MTPEDAARWLDVAERCLSMCGGVAMFFVFVAFCGVLGAPGTRHVEGALTLTVPAEPTT
jgi:hypothetical protein